MDGLPVSRLGKISRAGKRSVLGSFWELAGQQLGWAARLVETLRLWDFLGATYWTGTLALEMLFLVAPG